VTASEDCKANIYDFKKNEVIASIESIKLAEFSPDGLKVVGFGCDRSAKIFDLNKNKIIATIEHGGYVNSAKFSPDSSKVLTSSDDGKAKIISIREDELDLADFLLIPYFEDVTFKS